MSGAFGWIHNDRDNDPTPAATPFGSAQHAYQAPRPASVRHIDPGPAPMPSRKLSAVAPASSQVPGAMHALTSTAANVIIFVLDVTRSLGTWPEEIFKRLPLFYHEALKYLGSDDLEVLFVAHGDVLCDRFPLQVTRFERGAALDGLLASLNREGGGGGNGGESHEIAATYLVDRVDTSSARNVYTYFVTDEPGRYSVDANAVREHMGVALDPEHVHTGAVFSLLARRSEVFAILCDTQTNDSSTQNFWLTMVGPERIVPLDDARRIVDVALGCIAAKTHQMDTFSKDLTSRQGGTAHGSQNIATVLQSVAHVVGRQPKAPSTASTAGTRPLLPPSASRK